MYVRRWLMHFSAVVQYTCYCHIDLFLAHNAHYKKNGMITRKIVLHNLIITTLTEVIMVKYDHNNEIPFPFLFPMHSILYYGCCHWVVTWAHQTLSAE